MENQTPPADWYDDPTAPNLLRYWDGEQWTEHTAPRPTQQPNQQTAARTATEPAAPKYVIFGYASLAAAILSIALIMTSFIDMINGSNIYLLGLTSVFTAIIIGRLGFNKLSLTLEKTPKTLSVIAQVTGYVMLLMYAGIGLVWIIEKLA